MNRNRPEASTADVGGSAVPYRAPEPPHAQEARRADRARRAARSLPDQVDWRAVAVFLAISFAGAWLAALPFWLNGRDLQAFGPAGMQLILIGMMYAPSLATLVTVFLVQRPPEPGRLLGLHVRPARRTLAFLGIALAVPPLAYLLGTLLSIAVGASALDAEGGWLREVFGQSGVPVDEVPVAALAAVQLGSVLLIGVPLSTLAAFGEELGWRGWLLPELRPLGTWPALAISGAVWGLWHAPIVLLGYNFQDRGPAGLAAMTAFCLLVGVFLGWLRLRSASVYPAALAHGSLNSFPVLALMLSGPQAFSQPFVNGLGWTLWAPYALLAGLLAVCGGFRRQPLPSLTLAESEAARVHHHSSTA